MATEERKEELRRLADRLGYFGIESQACDAIKELLTENARLTARVAELEERIEEMKYNEWAEAMGENL